MILFDGICNLCNASVQSIIKRDKRALFHFASLQSGSAEELLKPYKTALEGVDSIVLLTDDGIYIKSEAVLQISRSLSGFVRVLPIFRIIPKSLRDAIYDWIARNRYGWFGKREVCMIPTPDLESRFLP